MRDELWRQAEERARSLLAVDRVFPDQSKELLSLTRDIMLELEEEQRKKARKARDAVARAEQFEGIQFGGQLRVGREGSIGI